MKRIVAGTFLFLTLQTQAALYIRDLDGDWSNGHEGVYDDVLDITWLADTRYHASSGYANANTLTFIQAKDWLNFVNTNQLFGFDGWRMPAVTPIVQTRLSIGGQSYDGGIRSIYDGSADEGFNIGAPISEYNPTGKSPYSTRSELSYQYYVNFEAIAAASGDNINGAAEFYWPYDIIGVDDARNQQNVSLFFNMDNVPYWVDVDESGFENQDDVEMSFKLETGQQILGGGGNVWLVYDGDIGTAAVPLPATAWLFLSALGSLLVIKRNA